MTRSVRILIVLAASLALLPAAGAQATITVANQEDSGPGSLRQAINEAASGETIVVPAGTYTLSSDELTIDGSVVISGQGPATTIIRSGGPFRVFDIDSGASNVTISGVTIRDGHEGEPGGTAEGAGIRNEGSSLSLQNVLVTNNHAEVSGEASGESGGTAKGAGIFSEGGALTLEQTVVSANSATAKGAGAGNGGVVEGAGLAVFGGSSLLVRNSTITGNVGSVGGGSSGGNGGIVEGGGLFASISGTTTASVSSSTVSANTGDASGGAGGGNGGIVEGGGVFISSEAPSVELSNVTIAGNSGRVPGGTGGNGGIAEGGGLWLAPETGAKLALVGATVAGNSVDAAGGTGGSEGIAEGGNIFSAPGVRIANSIVSGGVGPSETQNCASKLESLGFNLESSNQCGFTAVGDQVNTDPQLGPLQNNEGPAPTMAPATTSPAVDHGSAYGLSTDERGKARPSDLASAPNSTAPGADGSDIGAVELQSPVTPISPVATPPSLRPKKSLLPPDFVTAVFVPPKTLFLRLKCPARFKPACVGKAVAITGRDRCTSEHGRRHCEHGQPMTSSVSAAQKPNHWKVAKLIVKPKYRASVAKMATQPSKKLLIVRQLVHSKLFEHGAPQSVFHIYRVRTATSP